MTVEIPDPTGNSSVEASKLTDRKVRSLDGKTVGLLNNTKVKADYILDAVAELLQERFAIRKFIRLTKPTFARPVPAEMAKQMAAQCDVVITAIGS
jgi:hypothetical protein